MKVLPFFILVVTIFFQSCGCGSDIKLGDLTLSPFSKTFLSDFDDVSEISFSNDSLETITLTNNTTSFRKTEVIYMSTLCEEGIYAQSEYYDAEVYNINLINNQENIDFWYSIKSYVRRDANGVDQKYDKIYFNGRLNEESYFFNGVIDTKDATISSDELLFTNQEIITLQGEQFESIFILTDTNNNQVLYINKDLGIVGFKSSGGDLWVRK